MTLSSLRTRIILLLAALLSAASSLSAYEGEVLQFEMTDSQFYPGTHRTIKVYVPDRYDGKTPACLLVAMDGLSDYIVCGMDKLMEQGSMPVTSLAFAGKKLYVVSGGNVYVRNLRTGGFTGKGETTDRQGQG